MGTLSRKKQQQIRQLVSQHLATYHGLFLLLGLIAVFIYLPTWLFILWRTTFIDGKSTVILNMGFLYIGITQLWQRRFSLTQQTPLEDERLAGHLLILFGALSLPFCLESASLQAFILMLIFGGVLYSSFGLQIFKDCPLSCGMFFAGIYPDWAFLSNFMFHFLTGPDFLESVMAQLGSKALNIIRQPAVADGQYINLPAGSVLVGSGCTGFDMAFSIGGCSVLLGLFMKQQWRQICIAVFLGILVALVLNIPRIMLLTLAAVYWGKASFDFWHGAWGGQIFSGLLFSIYYYILMAIYNSKRSRRKVS